MRKIFTAIVTILLLCGSLPATAQDKSVPFLHRGHIILHATINDTIECDVLYDTGAANMFGVDSVWLSHSHWKPERIGYAMASGGAGKTKVRIVVDRTKVNIGNIENDYNIVPIFQLRDVVDCHIDGIWDVLNIADYPFEINFEQGFLKQHKSGKPSTEGYVKLPIKYENRRILFQAETSISGKIVKGWYLMDTGNPGTVDFTTEATIEYGLESFPGKRYITDITQFGLGDKEQDYYVDMQSDWIVIGGDTIRSKTVSYIPDGAGAFSKGPYIAMVGNAIWSKYNIIIDVKGSALYLRRFKDETPLEPSYDYHFRNRTDIGRGWIVSSLVRERDAVNAGMAIGDTIIAVNGRSVTDYSWEEEYNIDEQPRQVIDLIGPDGQKKQITLEAKLRW